MNNAPSRRVTRSKAYFLPALAAAATLGPQLHILVNNVGTNIRKPTVDYTPAEYLQLMATNLEMAMKLGAQQRAAIFDTADSYFWQAFKWTPEGRAAYTRTALDTATGVTTSVASATDADDARADHGSYDSADRRPRGSRWRCWRCHDPGERPPVQRELHG